MKRKGFTLIELLAVVIVLGIIAVIAVPSINNMLSKGKKDLLFSTANNLVETSKQYYYNKMLDNDEMSSSISLSVTDSANMDLLDFKGKLPENGYILIDTEGNIGLAVTQGDYCATKEIYSSEIKVTRKAGDCSVTSLEQLEQINSSCFVLNENKDTIIGYRYDNPSCGLDIVIPAEIGGKAITAIGDAAFVLDYDYILAGYDKIYNEDIFENADIYKSRYNMIPNYIFLTTNVPSDIQKECYIGEGEYLNKQLDYLIREDDIIKRCNVQEDIWGYLAYTPIKTVDFSYATNLINIGNSAFYNGTIESVNFGTNSNIQYIGISAFADNYISNTLDMSGLNKLETISSDTFYGNHIENVILPSNLTSIGVYAFNYNQLKNISIPSSVTSIGYNAFLNNDWISVTIEENSENNKYRFNDLWLTIGWPSNVRTNMPPINYVLSTSVNTFNYVNNYYVANVQTTGNYKLEVWGAQGSNDGGNGGYSSGTVYLTSGTKLYVYVGGQNGYNGGGGSGTLFSGGGSSDIGINSDSLYARVIVAGGGGTGSDNGSGGYGGGTLGGDAEYTNGGSDKFGGTGYDNKGNGLFGLGGWEIKRQGSGGGGWYGGGADEYGCSGAGGSGWVYTSSTFTSWQTGNASDASKWLLNSSYYLNSALTISGNSEVPTYNGAGTMLGNTGNGYVKITYIG